LFLDKIPGAHIFRLFLNPKDLGRIGVAPENIRKQLRRERIELLQTDDRDVVAANLLSLREQIVVNHPRTKQDAADVSSDDVRIANHLLERAAGQIANRGGRLRVTQQGLRREHNQGLADATPVRAAIHLPPQQMKILSGSRTVADLHIVFGTELEEALDTRARMFRSLPLEAVG